MSDRKWCPLVAISRMESKKSGEAAFCKEDGCALWGGDACGLLSMDFGVGTEDAEMMPRSPEEIAELRVEVMDYLVAAGKKVDSFPCDDCEDAPECEYLFDLSTAAGLCPVKTETDISED